MAACQAAHRRADRAIGALCHVPRGPCRGSAGVSGRLQRHLCPAGPSTCQFIGVSSQPVDALFAGTGTFTIRPDSGSCDPSGAGDVGPAPAGLYHPVPIGACGYTVTVQGAGTVTVVDPNVRFWGQCEGTSSCDHDALQGPGTVVGELVSTQQATLTLTVYDVPPTSAWRRPAPPPVPAASRSPAHTRRPNTTTIRSRPHGQ